MLPLLHQAVFLTSLFLAVDSLEVPKSRSEVINCSRSKVDYNVTLAEGKRAGSFLKANKSVTTITQCVRRCCQIKGCDIAFLSNGDCYSVKCKSLDSCAPTMNTDKSMSVVISYVAKPKLSMLPALRDSNAELEVTDNFIAEQTQDSPFISISDKDEDDTNFQQMTHEPWRDTKEAAVAIACGFIAVVVGVSGVIIMTRQLVEDEQTYPYTTTGKILSGIKHTLPRIAESPEENKLTTERTSNGERGVETERTNENRQAKETNENRASSERTNQVKPAIKKTTAIKPANEQTNEETIVEVKSTEILENTESRFKETTGKGRTLSH